MQQLHVKDEIIKTQIRVYTILGQRGLFKMSNARNRKQNKKTIDTGNKFLKTETSDCQENKKLTKLTRNK